MFTVYGSGGTGSWQSSNWTKDFCSTAVSFIINEEMLEAFANSKGSTNRQLYPLRRTWAGFSRNLNIVAEDHKEVEMALNAALQIEALIPWEDLDGAKVGDSY